MTIREYARQHGHRIAGRLHHLAQFDREEDPMTGAKYRSAWRVYVDDAGAEYHARRDGKQFLIITPDGDLI